MRSELILRPSRVAKYFEYSCERYIAYSSISDKEGHAKNDDDGHEDDECRDIENSEGSFAAEAGDSWERKVYEYLPKYYICSSFEKSDREELTDALDGADGVRFLYQPQFHVNPPCEGASWSDIRPDFIMVESAETENIISIIDVKLARHPKISHKMQVALYTKLLDKFLREYCDSPENKRRKKPWKLCGEGIYLAPSGKKVTINHEYGYLWNRTEDMKDIVSGSQKFQINHGDLAELRKYLCEFTLEEEYRYLDEFLDSKLPNVIKKIDKIDHGNGDILKGLDFCIDAKCEGCGNWQQCLKWGDESESIQLYPYLSRRAQQFIVNLADNNGWDILTVDGMREFMINSPEAETHRALLKESYAWKNYSGQYKNNLENMLDALDKRHANNDKQQTITSFNNFESGDGSMQLPPKQDVAIFLTLHQGIDPQGESMIFAYGIYVRTNGKAENIWGSQELWYVEVAPTMSHEYDLGRKFIGKLHEILQKVWTKNKEKSKGGITLQGYVFDQYEFDNIRNLLFGELQKIRDDDEMLSRQIIYDLLFWLQGERITSELDKHPEKIVPFPVVILSQEIQMLYKIPAYVTVNMWNVCKALIPEYDFEEMSKCCCTPFSDRIRLNKFYAENGELEYQDKANGYLRSRLEHESQLLEFLQTKAREKLCDDLVEPIREPISNKAINRDISALLYESSYESYLNRYKNRAIFVKNKTSAIACGKIIKVEYKVMECDKYKCEIKNASRNVRKRIMEAYVIKATCADSAFRILRSIRDFESPEDDLKGYGFIGTRFGYRGAKKADGNEKAAPTIITFAKKSGVDLELKEGDYLYIIEKVNVLNYTREKKGLNKIGGNDKGEGADKVSLLEPSAFSVPGGHQLVAGKTGAELARYGEIGGTDFVDTQKDVFRYVCEHNLTLLQGPPGTGKTDFIARLIVALRLGNKGAKKQLRVLISGFSHASINNALKKVFEKSLEANLADDIKFYKDKTGNSGSQIKDIEEIQQLDSVYSDQDRKNMTWETVFEQDAMVVVGATCWACYKTNPFFQGGEDAPCFDLIIIDEASQMTVTQGLLTMSYGNPGTTHYLIVGDNHQLPPIIQGNYETREGQPDLYHSIFQYYMDKQGTADYLKMLHLNFRMNEALSDYSAQKIYNKQKLFHGEKYLPYEDKKCTIGSQVLRMQDGWEKEELKNILDPKYPLVVVYLSGDTTGETEREKVAEIVELLQKYMLKKDGTHYSAEEFWQTAFGILSPYHRQIDALKDKIAEQYGKKEEKMPGNILIDTVDKLQGQEREAVVVSYGVNDAEEAVAQGDFIYSYRRLNVSLTRGKKKTIVFLTDELTDYPIELLGSTDEDLLKGVSFVCGLRRYLEDDENGFEAEKITENKPGSKVTVDIYRKRKVRH